MSKSNPRILIVDDVPNFHQRIRYAFRRTYEFEGAIGVDKLMAKLNSKTHFDLILLDLVLEAESEDKIGLELIKEIQEKRPGTPIIVVTGDSDYRTAAESIKRGAQDFLYKKDYDFERWDAAFRKAIDQANLKVKVKKLEREVKELKVLRDYVQHPEYPIIGRSPQTERLRKSLKIAAEKDDLTVLITGETGVGKSIAAHFLHYNSSRRRDQPFEEIFISNITQTMLESELFGAKKGSYTGSTENRIGRLQQADKGIVFLDEIGDLDLVSQSKLLQFLQKKTIRPLGGKQDVILDVQVVAATNKVMLEQVARGNFRRDLYERLKVFPIEIPPLRERREDIQDLLLHFLELQQTDDLNRLFTGEVRRILFDEYPWTGNVRELENAVTAMNLKRELEGSPKINLNCLPDEIKDFNQKKNAITVAATNGATPPEQGTAEKIELPDMSAWNIKPRLEFDTLQAIERALIIKNGVKGDVATYLGYKSSDDIRYRVVKMRDDHPDWIPYFPKIQHYYKRLLSSVKTSSGKSQ